MDAAGEAPKLIEEFVGRASTGAAGLSIARMRSPSGWAEPGQRPDFNEYTVVLRGALVVETEDGELTVPAGQAVHTGRGSGSGIARQAPTAPSTFPSVCPRSARILCTGIADRPGWLR